MAVYVAPLAGAWIEILPIPVQSNCLESLPSRERGLKFYRERLPKFRNGVAPLAGAWIEMFQERTFPQPPRVAPLAGAWIEIRQSASFDISPSVAPLAGAWIEIKRQKMLSPLLLSLPSRERGLKFCILITIISI